jgi:iron complex outermembrane receptor protein
MSSKSRLLPRAMGMIALAAVPAASLGQELEEVLVTAQKREQSVEKVPVAIDVFDAAALADSGVNNIADLKQISPSVSINSSAGSGQVFVRGIGSNVLGNGTYGSVATYIDGAYIPQGYSLVAGISSLQNVENIQVLKGPQGTLYGRNATGGALVITTKTPKPGDEFSGSIKASAGDFGLIELAGTVSGGFGDRWAGLLTLESHENDGYIKNLGGTNPADFDNKNGFSIRGKLVFAPTDSTQFTLGYVHSEDRQSTLGFQQIGQTDIGAPAGALFPGSPALNGPQLVYFGALAQFLPALGLTPAQAGATALPAALGLRFSNEHSAAFSNQVSAFQVGRLRPHHINPNEGGGGWYGDDFVTLTASFGFENFELVSTTMYNKHLDETTAEVLRVDPTSTFRFSSLSPALASFDRPNLGFSGVFDNKAFTQELYAASKGSRIEWIGGLYYFRQEDTTLLTGEFFGTSSFVGDNVLTNSSIAGFAEATFPLGESWKLTTGARYTKEKNDLEDRIVNNNPLNQAPCVINAMAGTATGTCNVNTIPGAPPPRREDSSGTYNLKLAYQADTWLGYLGASSGFKSGSLNANNPIAGQVGPEEIKSIEAGFKARFLNGRLRFNGAAFAYKYDNIQLSVVEVSSGSSYLIDGVKADVNGLELEVDSAVTENFSLFASGTLLDTEYKTDATVRPLIGAPTVQAINGNKLAQAPDTVINAGFNLRFPGFAQGKIAWQVNASHNSGYWINQTNTFGSGGDENDAFTTINTSVKFSNADDKFSATLWCNNLTDEEYFSGGADAAGGLLQFATAGRVRHFGLTLEYKY